MATTSAVEQQSSILEEAFGFVAEQRFYLRKAIQHNDMEMALRYGFCLANELRSSQLLPENYYKLYALVFWELQHLAAFASNTERHGLDLAEIYELVQCEGNALPRLYMLVTVGTVHIQASPVPMPQVLDDILSMLSAVQHPMRGLFLRYYLLQTIKDKLLWLGGARGALRCLLANLREAASLWSRLRLEDGPRQGGTPAELGPPQAPPPLGVGKSPGPGEAWRLDHKRHTLRLLVGAHVMHVARLQGLSMELHTEVVLPEMLRLSTGCEDAAGQAYLLECFVEVLPDHFHLQALDRVLSACAKVHRAVDLRPLTQHLLRRLTAHVLRELGTQAALNTRFLPEAVPDTFGLFHVHLQRLHALPRGPATPLASLLELQLELARASLVLHPNDAGRMELVLGGTVELLQRHTPEPLDTRSVAAIVDIVAAPLTREPLVPLVLAMPHHARLMAALGHTAQCEGASAMATALLAGGVTLSDCDTLQHLLVLIDCLIRDEGGGDESTRGSSQSGAQRHLEHDPVAFTAEQEKVARLVHLVHNENPDVTFRMLNVLHRFFNEGGPHRIVFTLPALVVAALRLISNLLDIQRSLNSSEDIPAMPKLTADVVFAFPHTLCCRLGPLAPEECLRLWLLSASAAERASTGVGSGSAVGATCGRFVEGGLACLEEQVHGADAQFQGLLMLVGTLRLLMCLPSGAYASAAERAVQCGSHMPTARLQSRALCLCSGLFWAPACHQAGRALGCLRGALRCADAAVHLDPMDVSLFVEVLDQAIHNFGQGNEAITAPFLSGLLALCVQHMWYVEPQAPVEALRGLHVALADLQERQAAALERAPSNPFAEAGEARLQSDEECAVSARFAKLQLQVAIDAPSIPMQAEVTG